MTVIIVDGVCKATLLSRWGHLVCLYIYILYIWDIFNTYVHVGVGYYLGDDYYLIDSRWTPARTQLDVTWMSRVFRIAK